MAGTPGRFQCKPNPAEGAIYGCPSGKLGYPTRSAAKRALSRAKRAQSGRKRVRSVYPCRRCPNWHMTSQAPTP